MVVSIKRQRREKAMTTTDEKLPWELEEEILSRVPPQCLARFRSVCKRWNGLFNERKFIKSHLARARPQFIFLSKSNMYSIEINDLDGVDPTVKLRDLPYFSSSSSSSSSCEIRYREIAYKHTTRITSLDGLLFCNFWPSESRAALWNPWLSSRPPPQVKWIEFGDTKFYVCGLGYDKNKVYKMFGYFICLGQVWNNYHERAAVYHCGSQAFKFIDTPGEDGEAYRYNVSLNGNLYWITTSNAGKHFIQSFDSSKEIIKPFCLLPCHKNHYQDELALEVFRGDGFSLLKQCYVTRKIEIWVTNQKMDGEEEEEVVWILLMTLPTTDLPDLCFSRLCGGTISYFIYDKTLVICCGDIETRNACIYIVRTDLFKKFPTGSAFYQCCHCVYAPNLISLHMISD